MGSYISCWLHISKHANCGGSQISATYLGSLKQPVGLVCLLDVSCVVAGSSCFSRNGAMVRPEAPSSGRSKVTGLKEETTKWTMVSSLARTCCAGFSEPQRYPKTELKGCGRVMAKTARLQRCMYCLGMHNMGRWRLRAPCLVSSTPGPGLNRQASQHSPDVTVKHCLIDDNGCMRLATLCRA
jgi:hypothetical protein